MYKKLSTQLLCVFLLFFLYEGTATAQIKRTISGHVKDMKSGEYLPGATILIPKLQLGTTSNDFGFYSITISDENIELYVSYIGYNTFRRVLQLKESIELDIEMETTETLKEVVVTATKESNISQSQLSAIELPIQMIKSMPAFLGEVDIMKAIQLLPGVQAGSEGSSGIYVRGGGPDQNLILLDGVPVYNVNHLFGFFSVFNADAIKNVDVYKGGFPAHYGGRLSSVIDIKMKEGDKNKFHGEGGIGLIASRLTLEGPIQKGKSSFMIAGRRTYLDVVAAPFFASEPYKAGYYFYDLNGKMNFALSNKDHLYISGYFGSDKGYGKEKDGSGSGLVTWGNATAVARWNHTFTPKLFGNLTAYYSGFNFKTNLQYVTRQDDEGGEQNVRKYNSGVQDKAIKYDMDFIPSPNHYIKVGMGLIGHIYSPSASYMKLEGSAELESRVGVPPVVAQEYDAYVEDDILFTQRLKANLGIHFAAFNVRNKLYPSIQPRVSARYLLNDQLSVKASYAQMNQFVQLLSNSSIGLPTDLWVPITDRIPPQKADQIATGIAFSHPKGFEVSLEGYFKNMKNVIEYKEGASFLTSTDNWEDKVEIGNAKSYGAEIFLQKNKGRLTGMAGYTLSWTNRLFQNLNNGKTFPYKYDRRHDFKVVAIYRLRPGIELGSNWVFGTGNAVTLPVASYMGPDGNEAQIYGSRNGYRMPAYHRGDFSIKFIKQKRKWERAWIYSIYNIYGRQNPLAIYKPLDDPSFKQISLFSVIPSISYQFKF